MYLFYTALRLTEACAEEDNDASLSYLYKTERTSFLPRVKYAWWPRDRLIGVTAAQAGIAGTLTTKSIVLLKNMMLHVNIDTTSYIRVTDIAAVRKMAERQGNHW